MIKEIHKHIFAYLVLVLGLFLGVVLFLGAWPNRENQRVVAGGIALFYMLWGTITHVKTKHISQRVILEYIGVGLLAGVLLVLVTI